MSDTTARLRQVAEQATEGPWERGDVWLVASPGVAGRDKNTCCYCSGKNGPPVRVDGDGYHVHRDQTPFEVDHLISSQEGLVAGNYDYEEGGIIAAPDAEFVATFDPVLVAAMLDVIEAAEFALGALEGNEEFELSMALSRFRQVAGG